MSFSCKGNVSPTGGGLRAQAETPAPMFKSCTASARFSASSKPWQSFLIQATEVVAKDWYSGWLPTYSFTKGQIATTVKSFWRAYSNAA